MVDVERARRQCSDAQIMEFTRKHVQTEQHSLSLRDGAEEWCFPRGRMTASCLRDVQTKQVPPPQKLKSNRPTVSPSLAPRFPLLLLRLTCTTSSSPSTTSSPPTTATKPSSSQPCLAHSAFQASFSSPPHWSFSFLCPSRFLSSPDSTLSASTSTETP